MVINTLTLIFYLITSLVWNTVLMNDLDLRVTKDGETYYPWKLKLNENWGYQFQPNALMSRLYLKGKVYELLSLYFNPSEATDIAECPFLVDEENVRKIRNAKQIMLERMVDPPSLTDLANEIGLSLKKLKEGFKQLYGSTVYQFVLDHKMNHARQLLGSGSYNVNEVAIQLGYSNSSHFIEAFKKKFGTTPKKYLLSVSS